MELGAQLYTVRAYTQTLEDFSAALRKVADIGYRTVQVSGTCAYEADWLRDRLRETGLRCVITHVDPGTLPDNPAAAADAHGVFDCRYIGIGSMPGGTDCYDTFVGQFKPAARAIAGKGCLLMYHNHNFEFVKVDRRNYLERLAEDFTPEEMGFTLDTYWVQAAGGDPAQWLRRLSGRVPCVHCKDMVYRDGGVRFAPVGGGNMNFDAILDACRDAGTEYLLVEQDVCYGEDPFVCLKRSYEFLTARGLA